MEAKKKCPRCRKRLATTEFYKNKSKPSGLTDRCKGCQRQMKGVQLRTCTSCKKQLGSRRYFVGQDRICKYCWLGRGWKFCQTCKKRRKVSSFYTSKTRGLGGLQNRCKTCINTESAARYKRLGPDYQRRLRYGLGKEEFDALWSSQGHRCAICKRTADQFSSKKYRLHIDHDHKTGKVRGVLCFACNAGLGKFEDNIDRLATAIAYLRETQ